MPLIARLYSGASTILMAITLLLMTAPSSWAAEEPLVTLRTESASFGIDAHGSVCSLSRNEDGRSYLAAHQPAPLLSVRIEGKIMAPQSAVWNAETKRLTLQYGQNDATVVLHVETRPTHVDFEVLDAQPMDRIELVLWGPFPTTIGDIIGETVGVVRDKEFAIGIQALNAKTMGGYPAHENDIETDTASHTDFGSVLQAYCRNRDHDRIIPNWGHDKYLVPAYHDGGVVGSKIALFGCPVAKALDTIGDIELTEGLPHPMLDGVWGKQAPNATCSYLIVDFGESTIDRSIEMAKRAGLNYLYNSSAFETWGHFELKRNLFPHGWDGLRMCAEKARKAGVRIGFHTLSNFITPNDPYVTPVPDPRLARIGSSVLQDDIDASQPEIPIAAPDFFSQHTDMNTVVIGEELVKYSSVSTQAPWHLLNCKRGAYGTRAAAHSTGASVGKLLDHSYQVFLTDASLSQEVARNIADLCNQTGAMQLSFDGLEGNWSTGYGQYGRTLFTKAWYDALSPALKGRVINDASNAGHFNWHIYTRMNWGEPWGAGFRKGQTEYRFKNQLYFERNLMPHMLGWFALSGETTHEDAEWLLARAAGYDAGFALATSLASTAQLAADPESAEALQKYGATPAILEAVREWETARMSGAFPENLKASLRDNSREFHLQAVSPGRWDLYPVVKLEPRTLGTAIRIQSKS
jgi:hypothetical protein